MLFRIWVNGSRRLSAEERAEISDMIGSHAATPPAAKPAFVLEPGAPLPAKLTGYYRHTYPDYAAGANGAPNYNNSKDGCTVKRWVSAGRKQSPPDLPPLDEPHRMAAWFRRRFPREPVPPVLLDYESRAPTPPQAAQEAPPASTVATPPATAPATNEAPRQGTPEAMTAIDFASIDPDSDAAVKRAAIIEEANGRRVQEASATGRADDYRKWFPIWQESANLLRQLTKEDREARKASGALLDRARVIAELSQLLEALRIMRETMPTKIDNELSKAASPRLRRVLRLISPAIRAAVEKVRDTETAIFQSIESLQSPSDVRIALEREAA